MSGARPEMQKRLSFLAAALHGWSRPSSMSNLAAAAAQAASSDGQRTPALQHPTWLEVCSILYRFERMCGGRDSL